MDYVYKFPVVRGIQATKEYYIAMVPLGMIPKLFPDIEYVPPEYRAQRRLNESRVPIISKYILNNRDSYVFSALAASIDGNFEYYSLEDNGNLGMLEISMNSRFLINDGQHRKAAIIEALQEDDSLADEDIPIVFFEDKGLNRSQQIFTDLNKNAVKTSNSIAELYDSRDELAVITRSVISQIPFLDLYTDKEKDILGKYSSKLFTLNAFYGSNRLIVGQRNLEDAETFLIKYWKQVVDNMEQWQDLYKKHITKIDLRENYIATQAIVLQALGIVGNSFYKDSKNMNKRLEGLNTIDWRRSAPQWYLRAIRSNGRIITSKRAAVLISNVIKQTLGMYLTESEKMEEAKYRDHIITDSERTENE